MLQIPKQKTRIASNLSATLFYRSSGTDVFVFKTKTRTSGIDWMWELWYALSVFQRGLRLIRFISTRRRLGNEIPRTFEVHCPAIETRVRLRVPEFDPAGGEGYKVFTRDHVVQACRKALKDMPSWESLIEESIRQGTHLELCWRRELMLDWVRWETDANGRKRPWAVLYGLCLGKVCRLQISTHVFQPPPFLQPHEITHLEARIGEHRPTKVTLSDDTHLCEPLPIEG